MKKTSEARTNWLTIRLSKEEEKKLLRYYQKTTTNNLSEYARAILLKEPVTVLYRNESADEFLAEMLQLKKELNAIGNNFNQVVHKLHILDSNAEIKNWLILNESHKKIFLSKVEEINDKLSLIYAAWSQK